MYEFHDESILVVYNRGTMNTMMLIWIGIAVFGLALYLLPFVRKRNVSEGFVLHDTITSLDEPSKSVTAMGIGSIPTEVVSTPNSTAGPSPDLNTLMRNVAHKLNGGVNTPDLELPSPTELEQAAASQGLREQPKEYNSAKSAPSCATIQPASNSSLQQGSVFQAAKPARDIVIVERPVKPIVNCVKVNKPVVNCVKVNKPCPKCPDMRDYIRKDSIPCWNCKLN